MKGEGYGSLLTGRFTKRGDRLLASIYIGGGTGTNRFEGQKREGKRWPWFIEVK